ncbi:sensor histidine kinase [Pedobacter agri]|uniref:sensor histidine kinase n=1 Tax=Pedobacter agri TaxID=454586 RepID=UPI00292D3975|nr:sensor histidine kinase [Pedobacter agri]
MNINLLQTLYKNNKVHFIAWSLYIIYEVFITGFISKQFAQPGSYLMVYILNISIFYIHAKNFRNALNTQSKTAKFLKVIFIIFIEIVGYTLSAFCLRYIFDFLHLATYKNTVLDQEFILLCVWRVLQFIGFSTGYVYILKSFEDRKKVEALERQSLVTQIEKQALENDLVQSQNNFLRSQINPHFLFNTLNFIYNDARKKAPMAADAIMNLAEMMRYALKRPEASEMVPLSEEVEQIEHLINLHQLRTANTINLKLEVTGDLFGLRFPPLILLTLVENIFKHGNVTHSTQPAIIKIEYENDNLNISTINMVNDVKGKEHESHHVGIDNINKRLANFYKEEYIFRYYKDPLNRYITEIDVPVVNPMARLNLNL